MLTRPAPWLLTLTAIVSLFTGRVPAAVSAETKTLVSFGTGFDIQSVVPQDAKPTVVPSEKAAVLRGIYRARTTMAGHHDQGPGRRLGPLGLRGNRRRCEERRHAACHRPPARRLPGWRRRKEQCHRRRRAAAGADTTVDRASAAELPAPLAEKLFGMRGYPGGYAKEDGLDVSQITQLIAFVNRPTGGSCVSARRYPGHRLPRAGQLGLDDA